MRRPPYARWFAAVAVLAVAAAIDLSDAPTRSHPYLTAPATMGQTLDESLLEWREVPEGVLPHVDIDAVVATRDLSAGEPLLPSGVTTPPTIPPDWWAVPLPIPGNPAPGTAVRIVLTDTSATVEGVVVSAAFQDGFTYQHTGLAAVPGEHADAVAAAAIDQRLVVLLAP